MLTVPAASLLPTELPRMHTRDHPNNYDPELWEGQYSLYRYLSRAPAEALRDRYRSLILNLRTYGVHERHKYPIQVMDSSWYWYKKEHETRLEFALRGEPLPTTEDFPPPPGSGLPSLLVDSSGDEALFRYSSRASLKALSERGTVSIAPARAYLGIERLDPRHDDEQAKRFFIPGQYTTITTKDGRKFPVDGDVRQTVSGPDYYVLCTSRAWDPFLIDAFQAECCVKIRDAERFAARLERATQQRLAGWSFHHNPVRYFDPYRRERNESIDHGMSKDFRFAYQQEYRFLWISLHDEKREAASYEEFTLGDLGDLIELIPR